MREPRIDVPRAAVVASAIFARAKHRAGVRGFTMEMYRSQGAVRLVFRRVESPGREYGFEVWLPYVPLEGARAPESLATELIARAWAQFLRPSDCWAITDHLRSCVPAETPCH